MTDADLGAWQPHLEELRDQFGARQTMAAVVAHVADQLGQRRPAAFVDATIADQAQAGVAALLGPDVGVDLLGPVWERLLLRDDRRSQGSHFTPRAVADRLAELVHSSAVAGAAPPSVWDPASGGGAFLLAMARCLEATGTYQRDAIVEQMHATDIDPVALDVCSASLELWSDGAAVPTVVCADALLDHPEALGAEFDIIIGNPPFLSQLAADTVRSEERHTVLASRFPGVVSAYLDEAGLFVALAMGRVAPAGVVGLIVPASLLGARDANDLRAMVSSAADLCSLWIDAEQSFDAAVDVVAPVFRRRSPTGVFNPTVRVVVGDQTATNATLSDATNWAALLAHGLGIPDVQLTHEGAILGDVASITAGFRQHFYGITDAVAESTGDLSEQPLVTSGAIEPLALHWGSRSVRFGGIAWDAPVLDVSSIEDPGVRAWFEDRQRPKMLLASQTRVLEAVVDTDGRLMPSVPVISLEPHDPFRLWHLAAVLSAPAVSATMLQSAAGTGLSRDAIRVRAKSLAMIPLPPEGSDWDEGARWAEAAQLAAVEYDADRHVEALRSLATAMNRAYGTDDSVGRWWWERLRLPMGYKRQAY